MSRRVYLLGVGIALVALAFVLTDALLWEPGLTAANVRRIRPGMTLQEVVNVFGRAPQKRFDNGRTVVWYNGIGAAFIEFDAHGQVNSADFKRWDGRASSDLAGCLRAWLGW